MQLVSEEARDNYALPRGLGHVPRLQGATIPVSSVASSTTGPAPHRPVNMSR